MRVFTGLGSAPALWGGALVYPDPVHRIGMMAGPTCSSQSLGITALGQLASDYLALAVGCQTLLLFGGLTLLGLHRGFQVSAGLWQWWQVQYCELLLGLNYLLTLMALGLGGLLGKYSGLCFPQGSTTATPTTTPFFFGGLGQLAVGPLNLYFMLLAHGLLALTLLSFRQGSLEEGAFPSPSPSTMGQRQQAQTIFGVLLAFLGLTLTLYFSCENLALFFLSFEATALPIFGVILFYGKRSPKFRAAAYLLYFTLLSAAPLLALLLLLYQRSGTLFYPELLALQHQGLLLQPGSETLLAFLAFFLPFGVKFSFFPLHSWLPEAHVEASTEGSMLLSGILLKLGFYGVVKCCLPLCGGALFGVAPALLSLALVGSLAASLATYRQLDLKKIIAYSSVVHMNLSLVGYLSLSAVALQGALFMNFSHAVVSAGLFSAVGLLQDRTRTRALPELSGLQSVMPLWSAALLLLLLANAGLPGTVGFVGEATLLWGCFGYYPYLGFLLLLPLTLMGLRNYLLYVQLCWGVTPAFLNPVPLATSFNASLLLRRWDLNPHREGTALLLLTGLTLLLGLWPSFLLGLLEAAALQPSLRWLISFPEALASAAAPEGAPGSCHHCEIARRWFIERGDLAGSRRFIKAHSLCCEVPADLNPDSPPSSCGTGIPEVLIHGATFEGVSNVVSETAPGYPAARESFAGNGCFITDPNWLCHGVLTDLNPDSPPASCGTTHVPRVLIHGATLEGVSNVVSETAPGYLVARGHFDGNGDFIADSNWLCHGVPTDPNPDSPPASFGTSTFEAPASTAAPESGPGSNPFSEAACRRLIKRGYFDGNGNFMVEPYKPRNVVPTDLNPDALPASPKASPVPSTDPFSPAT